MKLIVGLGNPGEKFKGHRHNVGFQFIDYLIEKLQMTNDKLQISNQFQNTNLEFSKKANAIYTWFKIKGKQIELFKPQTFMNKSGVSVKYAIKKHPELKFEDLIVVHDDLDIPIGKFKIQKGTGPKLHNGIESVENSLGTKDFWRVRIGVDNRQNSGWIDGESYTLQNFNPEEKNKIIDLFPVIFDRLKKDLLV